MKMVMKNGKKVPFYAADGIGKMNMGGMMNKKKKSGMHKMPDGTMMKDEEMGMNYGGMVKKKKPAAKMMSGGMAKKKSGYAYGGSVANCGASMKPNGKARK